MAKFDYFVVFAEMRTGSNLLEANINLLDGLKSHGEAFNPSFIGYPQCDDVLGITLATREEDPKLLIDAIKADDGLAGFRFFNNHDQRVLDICLPDPRCAKIILTRNPVDSFISWKIAKATGQWKLTNATHAKTEQIHFDPAAFVAHLEQIQQFQTRILNALQRSGQTAFYLAYEDLGEVEIMNGLAQFLGCEDRLTSLDRKLKKQNPASTSDKVINPDEMETALSPPISRHPKVVCFTYHCVLALMTGSAIGWPNLMDSPAVICARGFRKKPCASGNATMSDIAALRFCGIR